MPTIAEVRKQFPQYQDLDDKALADALHQKFYSDMPREEFDKKVGVVAPKEMTPAENFLGTMMWPVTNAANISRGVSRGVRDPIDAGAQLLVRAVEAVAPKGSDMERWAKDQRRNVEGINARAEQEFTEKFQEGKPPLSANLGRMAGSVALLSAGGGMSVPQTLTGQIARGTLLGGVGAAAQPVKGGEDAAFWEEKARQAATGAAIGAGTSAVLGGVSRMVQPKTSPEVTQLYERGVRPTIGQTLGGAANAMEQKAESIPILGEGITAARRRAVEEFNRAAYDDVLNQIGLNLPKNVHVGRKALSYTTKQVSQAYRQIVPHMASKVDKPFADDLTNLVALSKDMAPDKAKQFSGILSRQVLRKISQNGTITGETMKEIDSALGQIARNYKGSPDPDQRLLGDAVREAQNVLFKLVKRSNPEAASVLDRVDAAYARLARLQDAAGRVGSKEGVFSPSALNSAVRAGDKSLRHGQFARGDALMQDFATAGEKVLGPNVPDSGTAGRAMLAWLMATGGAGAVNPYTAIPAAAAGAAYTPAGQRLAAALLARRPPFAAPIRRGIEAISGPVSIVAGGAGTEP